MLGARSIPAPKGRLASRSLGALLASARARRASVVLTLTHGDQSGEITFVHGRVLRATTSDDVARLGMLLLERGILHDRALGEALEESTRRGVLLGTVLVERRLVTPAQLADALALQTCRRVLHLFTFPDEARYEVRELPPDHRPARDASRPTLDPWPLVHRGLTMYPRPELVRAAVARLEGMLRLRDLRVVDELRLAPGERAFCETLAERPASVTELLADTRLPRERAEHLVYLLALGRHLERTAAEVLGPAELGAEGIRARLVFVESEDAHAILGVPEAATGEAIRAAYFRLARVWHPDRLPASLAALRPECDRIFSRMTDAFRVLMERPLPSPSPPRSRPIDEAPARSGTVPTRARGLVSVPPPKTTLTDVDRALSRADFEKAAALAAELVRSGEHGPAARAVVAMCGAAGPKATFADVEAAIGQLDQIIASDPECVRALFYRGILLKRLRRIDAAVRDFRRIVRLEPTHVDAQRELRLADLRGRAGSGEHAALSAALTPRAIERPKDALGPGPRGPTTTGSGLFAMLARVVGRT